MASTRKNTNPKKRSNKSVIAAGVLSSRKKKSGKSAYGVSSSDSKISLKGKNVTVNKVIAKKGKVTKNSVKANGKPPQVLKKQSSNGSRRGISKESGTLARSFHKSNKMQTSGDDMSESGSVTNIKRPTGVSRISKTEDRTVDRARALDLYRRWGHLQADIDPLGTLTPFPHRDFDALRQSGIENEWREFESYYCGKIGAEFMHLPYPERAEWIASRMESAPEDVDERNILKRILSVETFERFLHTKYVGAKRFSLEGLAVIVPLLDSILDQAAERGVELVMLAMAHRGRLNVMHHIADTLAEHIIANFEDIDPRSALGGDDVKYHKGATGTYVTSSGKSLEIELAPNPSHLEAVNPVIMGRTKARQERMDDPEGDKVLCIILHGDAAFAGQGIAAEALNYAEIPGFSIGGVIHVIVNNLIGFTATQPALYTGRYCTEIAKRIPAPVFHVNGESPNDVVRVGKIATDYRGDFKSDVVIDVIGYRKYGHNEVDDPTLTSPVLYHKIKERPVLFQLYAEQIGVDQSDIEQLEQGALALFEESLQRGRSLTKKPVLDKNTNHWSKYFGGLYQKSYEVPTNVTSELLEKVGKGISEVPTGFSLHPKLGKLLESRLEMSQGKRAIDWGGAEALAFGTLLEEGIRVRLVGQDSGRGTFTHRQAVLRDFQNGQVHIPLCHLSKNQAVFEVYDSMLSEAAAVGYEYGFTREYPDSLVMWEAQFGDFVNGAQIIIDQFISAAEDKWGSLSGLVMLLPHGYEGAGPEHSSARLERFLQLCAEDNMQVAQPSSASQYFHLLRTQALRPWRKPLIVMTPKSMLRLPAASSSAQELVNGKFNPVLDLDGEEFLGAERLIFCSGKIVHELKKERDKRSIKNTAISSIEIFYPSPEEEIRAVIKKYRKLKTILWVQDEPANMGALFFIMPIIKRLAGGLTVLSVKRSASASPSTGSPKAHLMEQEALFRMAFSVG
ncbi:MAG TPA: 2-oxoglutarate dehydrogenase E1 component [Oligoflexia bacterium]|nr:2-oxoglutarate dehydrogenase E1 component [Oligoflexia bacterium]HMP48623.1 2-oxoglutarate dehydrogenase E1 component [Oligoflexia bacterium]